MKSILALLVLAHVNSWAFAQDSQFPLVQVDSVWVFQDVLPEGGIPVDSALVNASGMHGLAVDGDGKIWLQPFAATEEIVLDGVGGAPVSTRALYIFNPDGTEVDFSPLTVFEYVDGSDVDTVGHYWHSHGRDTPGWEGMSGRGLRSDDDGNILVSTDGVIYRIRKDGKGMNKFPYLGADGRMDSPTAAAVDGQGNVYVAPVVPGANNLIKLPKDFNPSTTPEVILAETPGYSRTFEVSADGNTIYWNGYSNGAVYVYSRTNGFSPFDPNDYTEMTGLSSESATFHPVTGHIWLSGGSTLYPASNGYANQTWYAFDPSNLATPLESITWNGDAMDNSEIGVGEGRPRGLAFSPDGATAYVVQFNEAILAAQVFRNGTSSPPSGEISLMLTAPTASRDGTIVVDVLVQGLDATDQVLSYEFSLPLPDNVEFDSVITTGTQSSIATGQLASNVSTVSGSRVLKVSFADTKALPGGDLPLFQIALRLTSADDAALMPSSLLLNTQAVSELRGVTLRRSVLYGDVDGNERVQAYDAALVLQYVVGMDPLPQRDPRPWESSRVRAADVDGDSLVLAMDASLILQRMVHLITEFPAEGSGAAKSSGGADGKAQVPAVSVVARADSLVFSTTAGLAGFELEMPLVKGLDFGQASTVWEGAMTAIHRDSAAGVVRIAFAAMQAEDGEFLRVPFTVDRSMVSNLEELKVLSTVRVNAAPFELEIEFSGNQVGVSTQDVPGVGDQVPTEYRLEANYPNPFNPTTRITYALVEAQPVRLEVYSITGARVATLVDGVRPAGVHAVEFDASGLSSGVYLYRISTPAFSGTRSMVMLK